MAYATTLCSGLDHKDVKYGQLTAKPLLQLYSEQKVTPFSCSWNLKKTAAESWHELISLHCICRQPEDGKMIQCDKCNQWFHKESVQVPESIKHVDWICFLCYHHHQNSSIFSQIMIYNAIQYCKSECMPKN